MRYQGSKRRLAKFIVPILQDYIDKNNIKHYIEPFVGSAAIIQNINCACKIGTDNNKDLIALLQYMQKDPLLSIAPEDCTFEHYKDVRENRKNNTGKYSLEYTALIGYCASYGGRYFDGGFGRSSKGQRSVYKEAIGNLRKQAPLLNGINFDVCDYKDWSCIKDSVLYLDPPYNNTKSYNGKKFNSEELYNWAEKMSENNIVIVSEYNMPENFKCIFEHDLAVSQKSDRVNCDRATEKLWILK